MTDLGFENLVKLAKSVQARSLNGVTPDDCGDWADIAGEGYRLAQQGEWDAALAALITPSPGLLDRLAEPEAPPSLWRHFTLDSGLEYYATEQPWLIYGLYQEDSIGMIYGDGGSGKTYLAINQALHLACGLPWLSKEYPASEKKGIMYFISEGRRQFFVRLLAAVNGLGQPERNVTEIKQWVNENILVATDVPQLFAENARLSVDSYLDFWRTEGRPKIDLVTVDTLHRAAVGAQENSSDDANTILEQCRRLSREIGCAVQLIHHTNKAGGYRGASAYRDDIDVALKIEGRGRDPRTIIIDKERDCPPDGPVADSRFVQDFLIDSATQASFVAVKPEVLVPIVPKIVQAKAKIEQILAETPAVGVNEIIRQVGNLCSKPITKEALTELEKEGQVIYEDGPNRSKLYSLSSG